MVAELDGIIESTGRNSSILSPPEAAEIECRGEDGVEILRAPGRLSLV